ncbi:hypothetical protein [Nocardioides limicola]|uniref:hypothetical protein n=1 Tax=Nocardioides limicola TaxID=2803368 RepID=UPI00193C4376|nr:hypothetical protein [Nocardioides sp. DJM-14]
MLIKGVAALALVAVLSGCSTFGGGKEAAAIAELQERRDTVRTMASRAVAALEAEFGEFEGRVSGVYTFSNNDLHGRPRAANYSLRGRIEVDPSDENLERAMRALAAAGFEQVSRFEASEETAGDGVTGREGDAGVTLLRHQGALVVSGGAGSGRFVIGREAARELSLGGPDVIWEAPPRD